MSQLRRSLYRTASLLGDAEAIAKGRVGRRLVRRSIWKMFAQFMRGRP